MGRWPCLFLWLLGCSQEFGFSGLALGATVGAPRDWRGVPLRGKAPRTPVRGQYPGSSAFPSAPASYPPEVQYTTTTTARPASSSGSGAVSTQPVFTSGGSGSTQTFQSQPSGGVSQPSVISSSSSSQGASSGSSSSGPARREGLTPPAFPSSSSSATTPGTQPQLGFQTGQPGFPTSSQPGPSLLQPSQPAFPAPTLQPQPFPSATFPVTQPSSITQPPFSVSTPAQPTFQPFQTFPPVMQPTPPPTQMTFQPVGSPTAGFSVATPVFPPKSTPSLPPAPLPVMPLAPPAGLPPATLPPATAPATFAPADPALFKSYDWHGCPVGPDIYYPPKPDATTWCAATKSCLLPNQTCPSLPPIYQENPIINCTADAAALWRMTGANGTIPSPPYLPSWNDGPVRSTILDFLSRATNPLSPDYIPPQDRVAVFDNDGTVISEMPTLIQMAFLSWFVKYLSDRGQDPGQVMQNDLNDYISGVKQGDPMSGTLAGLSVDLYMTYVSMFLQTALHPKYQRPYNQMAFVPMVEVLQLFQSACFSTYVVSGGETLLMRKLLPQMYGVPPQNIIGSFMEMRYEKNDQGKFDFRISQRGGLLISNDRLFKPVTILRTIGKQPQASFGNSDGDFEMMMYSSVGPGPHFSLFLKHDDGVRETVYEQSMNKVLDAAPSQGWVFASIKRDFKRVFSFDYPPKVPATPYPPYVPRVVPMPPPVAVSPASISPLTGPPATSALPVSVGAPGAAASVGPGVAPSLVPLPAFTPVGSSGLPLPPFPIASNRTVIGGSAIVSGSVSGLPPVSGVAGAGSLTAAGTSSVGAGSGSGVPSFPPPSMSTLPPATAPALPPT